jgi:predicted Zn-dependent peptidase
MAISVVGDFNEKKIIALLEKHFSGVKQLSPIVKPLSFQGYKPFDVTKKESNFQAHVNVGSIAPGLTDEHERRALTLLMNVLGGPALNSRLVLAVREKYGYTYNIEASYTVFKDIGYWNIYFGCEEKYVSKTLKVVERELAKLRSTSFSSLQLHRAKEQFKGQYALSLESHVDLMIGLGKTALNFEQIDSVKEIYQAIDSISSQQLLDVANKYLNSTMLSKLIYLKRD